jgi:tryptophanyl-tRNA synthetase
MRPTGRLHLGNYHGALKNWIRLQHEYDCFFFVADWHALTTDYEDPSRIEANVADMVIDWLAAGLNPTFATLFIQSRVPEHAELHLLLSMIAPLAWLERVPTYKDQQEKLAEKELDTYGFLGYPLLQSAASSSTTPPTCRVGGSGRARGAHAYRAALQFPGAKPFPEEGPEAAIRNSPRRPGLSGRARRKFMNRAPKALEAGRQVVERQPSLTVGDRERLFGYLEGGGRTILFEPQALLTPIAKMPGLDGQKMSKSYGNTIDLRDEPDVVVKKLRTMPTDPARVRRTDPGDPEKCPVWLFHQVYSDEPTREWVQTGCRSAGIGCLDCKQKVIDKVLAELAPSGNIRAESDTSVRSSPMAARRHAIATATLMKRGGPWASLQIEDRRCHPSSIPRPDIRSSNPKASAQAVRTLPHGRRRAGHRAAATLCIPPYAPRSFSVFRSRSVSSCT